MKRSLILAGFAGAALFLHPGSSAANDLVLITPAEANLPAGAPVAITRGISRGPTVEQIEPPPNGKITSPTEFKVIFEPHGGTTIDPKSVKITYLKSPAIDLTQRLKAFVTPTGIDVAAADVPPGLHVIKLDVADDNGHVTTHILRFSVQK